MKSKLNEIMKSKILTLFQDGLSYSTIAARMGIHPSTVRLMVHPERAKKRKNRSPYRNPPREHVIPEHEGCSE